MQPRGSINRPVRDPDDEKERLASEKAGEELAAALKRAKELKKPRKRKTA